MLFDQSLAVLFERGDRFKFRVQVHAKAKTLTNAGANLKSKSVHGKTAIDNAKERVHKDVVEKLKRARSSVWRLFH